MRSITEQEIAALAPNAGAISKARKISAGGDFVSRMRSADDSFYMGECRGSGASYYRVSADFSGEEAVLRCSCPSRQFPCKHSLALLFEMAAGKEFLEGEIPADITEKRAKKEAREAKKAAAPAETAKPSKPSKASQTARIKKLKKQLEGLALMKQLTDSLVDQGLASMGSASLKSYRELSKQLGDYYLPGPQADLNRLILEMEAHQKAPDPIHYKHAVEILKRLRALEKKASVYLTEQMDSETLEAGDNLLYEELGGIWKLDQLNALGLKKENARLLQLSFRVYFDEARKEYVDQGFWGDIDTGEVSITYNYRPLRALKHIKEEDSCFALKEIPVLTYYPGEPANGQNPHGFNRRIRWDKEASRQPEAADYKELMSRAYPELASAVKAVKNQLKNTLADEFCALLLAFDTIGTREGEKGKVFCLKDKRGSVIRLGRMEGWEDTAEVLSIVPEPEKHLRDQCLFGLMGYDPDSHKMFLCPMSILTEEGVIRLLY